MNSGSSWQVFSLLCSITLISTTDCHIFSHVHARNVNGLGDQSFVDSLFEKYGTNKSMDLKQFEALLKELKVGSMQATESGHGHHESESESSHGHHDTEGKGSDKVRQSTFTIRYNWLVRPVNEPFAKHIYYWSEIPSQISICTTVCVCVCVCVWVEGGK